MALGSDEELTAAVGTADASRLLHMGVGVVANKHGGRGVTVYVAGQEPAVVPPHPVDVVNGLGAGDAFGGAVCHGLLAGWDLERILWFANAAGSWVAGRLACADAMPTEDEVEELMGARA